MSESVFYVKLIHYRKIKDALLHCKRCPFAIQLIIKLYLIENKEVTLLV